MNPRLSPARLRDASLREQVARWNRRHPVGATVRCRLAPGGVHRTRSLATIMFARRAVIYLEGLDGYLDLNDVEPVALPLPTESRCAVLFPGQGAQRLGMGRELFAAFPDQTLLASQILGYSVERLCLDDPDGLLDRTEYTQAAIYVVNALGYVQLRRADPAGDAHFLLGHSVGEYNALLAAGVFDFETGLQLVIKRGELMGKVAGGAMAAVRANAVHVRDVLNDDEFETLDLANYNAPLQTVIAGPVPDIERAVLAFAARQIEAVRLRVSGPGHSRYMQGAQERFAEYARTFTFAAPRIPVVANVTGRPYEPGSILETLCAQMTSPVRWIDSIQYVLDQGETEFMEVGSDFLGVMVRAIAATDVHVQAIGELG